MKKIVLMLQKRLAKAEDLLKCSKDYMDNTHGYEYDLYNEIIEFLEEETEEL